jgi:hypothetical protein
MTRIKFMRNAEDDGYPAYLFTRIIYYSDYSDLDSLYLHRIGLSWAYH